MGQDETEPLTRTLIASPQNLVVRSASRTTTLQEEALPSKPNQSTVMTAVDSSAPSPQNQLAEADWYWGDITREEVNDLMVDRPDGTFLVRDASSRIKEEYTLTLRKDGQNRLIRILHGQGRFGFSEPLVFSSVMKLIQFYHSQSLASYNSQLDTPLLYPVCRHQKDQRVQKDNMDTVGHQYQEESREYELFYEDITISLKAPQERQGDCTIEAFTETIQMFGDQCESGERYIHMFPTQETHRVQSNPEEVVQWRLEEVHDDKRRSEEGLGKEASESTEIVRMLNILKPDLVQLKNITDQYTAWLTRQGTQQTQKTDCPEMRSDDEQQYSLADERTWYVGSMRRGEAERVLQGRRDGTFLIRDSQSQIGCFACSVVMNGATKHCVINKTSSGCGFTAEPFNLYPSLRELVLHYSRTSLAQHNPQLNVTLTWPALSPQPS